MPGCLTTVWFLYYLSSFRLLLYNKFVVSIKNKQLVLIFYLLEIFYLTIYKINCDYFYPP